MTEPTTDTVPRPRRGEARVDGILVVDKPVGPTSHDIVALVRRLAGTRKIGHGGTLDPFASGVLPLYLGLGTRVVEFHLGARKAYRATVCFGASSTTDDLEGELTPADGPPPTREAVEGALAALVGTVEQRPPAFSARKVGGRRAYALARRGETPELKARDVTFYALDLVSWDETEAERPLAVIDVACSAGTYVRALARDLGVAVGSAAFLGALRRTASGPFTLDDALPLDAVREAAAAGRFGALLRPVDAGLDDLPAIPLEPDELRAVAHGGWVGAATRLPADATGRSESVGARFRLVAPDGALVAIARRQGARLVPDKVLLDRGQQERTQPERPAERDGLRPNRAGRGMTQPVAGIGALRPEHGPLLIAVGVFDGLHRGHVYLLRELRRAARRLGARPAVLTFDHHPDEILAGAAPPLLCDPEERLARLERAGVAVTIVQHFDDALRRTSYQDFVAAIRERTTLAGFLMTPDAAFGHERRGTPPALAALGASDGFGVVVVPPFDLEGHPVRSSEVRAAIAAGDLAHARFLLGRRVAVTGTVEPTGHDRAQAALAFPLPVALPPEGTYRGTIEPPLVPGAPRDGHPRVAVLDVSGGTVTVAARGAALRGDRLRAAFREAR